MGSEDNLKCRFLKKVCLVFLHKVNLPGINIEPLGGRLKEKELVQVCVYDDKISVRLSPVSHLARSISLCGGTIHYPSIILVTMFGHTDVIKTNWSNLLLSCCTVSHGK